MPLKGEDISRRKLLVLNLRWQRIERDPRGRACWTTVEAVRKVAASRTALLLCDVWDRHWCRGANERLSELLPRMAETVRRARERGVQIIHTPSDTMPFYQDTPARQRIASLPLVPVPPESPHDDPPLLIDHSDCGSDTYGNPDGMNQRPWTRQHAAIDIDQGRDVMLSRDLTDSMYNPALPPYVSHDEGTGLVVAYIEKFWCPMLTSRDLGPGLG